MVDPSLLTVVVSGAAGGIAGAFAKEVAQKGTDWLIQLVAAHSPAVQRKAQENAQRFIQRLAKRVERLEADLPTGEEYRIGQALDEPSTSLLIQKSLISAAVTDNDDRHQILTELIAQRLAANADDMISLVGAAACDVVGALSSRQLHLLGLMVVLQGIRPTNMPSDLNIEEKLEWAVEWWSKTIPGIYSDDLAENTISLDYQHLVGLGCVWSSVGHIQLNKMLIIFPDAAGVEPKVSEMLSQQPWWEGFEKMWKTGLSSHYLTSKGSLIGILYSDSMYGHRTTIDW